MKNKGIIPINKPQGWTSFDVVNKIKHMVKPFKVGHLGTLDPMATGVLLITIGKATKLFDYMQEKTKTYIAEFEFGVLTDSLDITGKIIEKTDKIPSREQIEQILPEFIGEINQIPPKFSAKNINGVRAYSLARKGQEFELKAKKVLIESIEMVNYKNKKLTIKIVCGSGTYIRALGRDIASKCNSFATMTSLVRTQISNFSLEDCWQIDEINKENIDSKIVNINNCLNLPEIKLNKENFGKIMNGVKINVNENNGIYKLNDENDCVALIKIEDFSAKMIVFLN